MAGLRQLPWFTWANVLTSLRLVAAIPLYYSIEANAWWAAAALFWLAVASDLVDGRVARARGESSPLGGFLDHGTDATFVVSGLLALSNSGQVAWLLPFVVGAAFFQYMFDSNALAGQPLRASALGRWNGILYFVPVGVVVTRECLSLTIVSDSLVLAASWALVLTTLLSMADRGWALYVARRSSAGS